VTKVRGRYALEEDVEGDGLLPFLRVEGDGQTCDDAYAI
jgi:hypothetical protein